MGVERPVFVTKVDARIITLTVDGDCNAFVEGVTISADEGWDLSKLVDLEVFSGDSLCRSEEFTVSTAR